MSPSVTRPHSLNLDHQLSNECKARTPSAMKALGKLMMGKPGLVSLAGGQYQTCLHYSALLASADGRSSSPLALPSLFLPSHARPIRHASSFSVPSYERQVYDPAPFRACDVGPWAAGTAEKKEFELVKNGQPGSCVIDLARGMQ